MIYVINDTAQDGCDMKSLKSSLQLQRQYNRNSSRESSLHYQIFTQERKHPNCSQVHPGVFLISVESMYEEQHAGEPQEKGEKHALVRSCWLFQWSRFAGTLIRILFPLLSEQSLPLELFLLHYNYTTHMNKQTFLLPETIIISRPTTYHEGDEIKYYSDCVFNPYVHQFNAQECKKCENDKLELNFSFVLQSIKQFPKILDNIGVLKLGNSARYGVLITKEKEGYFLSLID